MLRTMFLNPKQTTLVAVKKRFEFLTWRELAIVVIAGIALAGIGQFLGRMVHLAWPVPMSGSVITALPRAFILLVILLRLHRFGALTVTAIAEVTTRLTIGFVGFWPMSLVVPVLAGFAGDLVWQYLRNLPSRRLSLILTGAFLCTARILLALSCWILLMRPIAETGGHLLGTTAGIVAINVVSGMAAGLLAGEFVGLRKFSW